MNTKNSLFIIFISVFLISQIKSGIFSDKEKKAKEILNKMNPTQRCAALFLEKYPEDISKYKTIKDRYPSGFILDSKFFDKEDEQLEDIFKNLQKKDNDIKFTIGVEEEGGEHVTCSGIHRDEPFMSPMETLFDGGKKAFTEQEHEKIEFLKEMYTNMNLAPVADICSDKNSPMWSRTVGLDINKTTESIMKMVDEYLEDNYCACIKHFPGFGDNKGEVTEIITDDKPWEEIDEQLKPFKEAINAGIPMVFLSNLIFPSFNDSTPVSTSQKWSEYLFNNLSFTGLALAEVEINEENLQSIINNKNEMILTKDFEKALNITLNFYNTDPTSKQNLDETVLRILEWKLKLITTNGPKEKKNYTGIVVGVGVSSFVAITIIAFIIYKFWLLKKEKEGLGEIAQFGGHPAYREESLVTSSSATSNPDKIN